MSKIQEIHEFCEVWDIISLQAFDPRINRYRSSYLYRGMPNVNFHLETSLARNCRELGGDLESRFCVISQNMHLLKILGW